MYDRFNKKSNLVEIISISLKNVLNFGVLNLGEQMHTLLDCKTKITVSYIFQGFLKVLPVFSLALNWSKMWYTICLISIIFSKKCNFSLYFKNIIFFKFENKVKKRTCTTGMVSSGFQPTYPKGMDVWIETNCSFCA